MTMELGLDSDGELDDNTSGTRGRDQAGANNNCSKKE